MQKFCRPAQWGVGSGYHQLWLPPAAFSNHGKVVGMPFPKWEAALDPTQAYECNRLGFFEARRALRSINSNKHVSQVERKYSPTQSAVVYFYAFYNTRPCIPSWCVCVFPSRVLCLSCLPQYIHFPMIIHFSVRTCKNFRWFHILAEQKSLLGSDHLPQETHHCILSNICLLNSQPLTMETPPKAFSVLWISALFWIYEDVHT